MKNLNKYSANQKPTISTASLPDIIFILLFFFMVVTVMRNSELMLKIELPKATQLDKLHKKSLINHIYIGKPRDGRYGEKERVQINDAFVDIDQLGEAILQCENGVPEYLIPKVINSLKVDKNTKMGVVTDVKIELRKVDRLKVNYAALQSE